MVWRGIDGETNRFDSGQTEDVTLQDAMHSVHDITLSTDDNRILQVGGEDFLRMVANITPERRNAQRLALKVEVRPIKTVQGNVFNGHGLGELPEGTRFPVIEIMVVTL